MNIYSPYTYHIFWSSINIHYYGVRFAKNCTPDDLWVTYFTSSRLVKGYRKIYGEPDIIEVRKIFNNANDAMMWESRVLRRLSVLDRNDWLNANISGIRVIKNHSAETKNKMSMNNASRRPEIRKLISERQAGTKNSFYGKTHTQISNESRSNKCKGYYWWTDGHTEIKSRICPSGFVRGRSALGRKLCTIASHSRKLRSDLKLT